MKFTLKPSQIALYSLSRLARSKQTVRYFVQCVFSYYIILSVVISNVLPQGPDNDHTQNT